MLTPREVKPRVPNWLPAPARRVAPVAKEPVVDENDLFPKGEIVKFFQQQDYGFIHDQHGSDVYFHLNELDLVGPKNKRDSIRVGAKVGYDVSWTSHGLHVRRLKIY